MVYLRRYAWITEVNYGLPSLWVGVNLKVLNSNLSSQTNRNKMRLLNALIKPTVMRYSMRIYLKTSEKFEKLQKTGSRFTTKKDRTALLAECRLESIEHRQKTTL